MSDLRQRLMSTPSHDASVSTLDRVKALRLSLPASSSSGVVSALSRAHALHTHREDTSTFGLHFAKRSSVRHGGHMPVHKRGVRWYVADFYFYLLSLPWYALIPVLLTAFLLVSLLFAALHVLVPGTLYLDGAPATDFWDILYISLSIMSDTDKGVTVDGNGKRLMVLVQGITQLVALAIVVGVVVDRLTHPHPRVRFADQALIALFNGQPTFMFRLAWERSSRILDAQVRCYVYQNYRTPEGVTGRRLMELPLSLHHMPVMTLSWQCRHVITDDSPLAPYALQLGIMPSPGMRSRAGSAAQVTHGTAQEGEAHQLHRAHSAGDAAFLCAQPEANLSELDVMVLFSGDDETQRETVRSVHTYRLENIMLDGKYADIISFDSSGTAVLDFNGMDSILPVEPAHRLDATNDAWHHHTARHSTSVQATPATASHHTAAADAGGMNAGAGATAAAFSSPAAALHGITFSPFMSPAPAAVGSGGSVNHPPV